MSLAQQYLVIFATFVGTASVILIGLAVYDRRKR